MGWLVGEPNQGLRYMFQMMNEARIATGRMGTGIASAAYHASLEYAKERPQGRQLGDRKSTRLNSSHQIISYAVFCLKKKNKKHFVLTHIIEHGTIETIKPAKQHTTC